MKRTDQRTCARLAAVAWLLAIALFPPAAAARMPAEDAESGPADGAAASAVPLPDVCLAPNATELLAPCPPGVDSRASTAAGLGAAPAAGVESTVRPARPPDAGAVPPLPQPRQTAPPPDPREVRLGDLVLREIALTERLLETTPDTDPDKPGIRFRLAQLYYEMQAGLDFAAGERDMQCLDLESRGESNAAQECYRERDRLRGQANEWSDKAIEAYYGIVTSFPDWERVDEALFYLAFAFEERARTGEDPEARSDFQFKARSVYNVLIRDHQGSPYVPHAYLSFAEYYFNEEGDMYRALEYYDKILGIEGNRVYGYAMYKKAWCLYNLQEYRQSLSTFEDVIAYAQQHTENADSPELLRTARLELPLVYAQSGRADQAWRYFARVGGDLAVRMMQSLAEYYYSQGQHDDAIIAYHTLMDRDRESDDLCDYQYWVTQSRMAQAVTEDGVSSQDAKQAVVDELRNMVDVWRVFVVRDGSRHDAERVRACSWWAADFLIDTAVRWHREAAGTAQQPGTDDRGTMAKALDLYESFIRDFGDPAAPYFYDRQQAPEGWEYRNPYTVYDARYFRAELLWKMERWLDCGEAFDEVVVFDPAGPRAEEAMYGSVLCFRMLYEQEVGAREDRGATWDEAIPAPREFTDRERRMERAFHRYVCHVDRHEDLANVEFSRAFLHLDAGRWQEAAVLFKAVAGKYEGADDPDDRRIAVLSAMNYFEIVVRLRRAGVEGCAPEVLAATAAVLDGGFPAAGDAAVLESDEERESLRLYLEAVPVLHCDQMLAAGRRLTEAGRWEPAAELMLRIHDEYPQAYPGYRCVDDEGRDRMPAVLDEAANYLENANKVLRAVRVRERLVQEHPDSGFVAEARIRVARAYARLAFFEKAAESFEAFARGHATGRQADERAPEAMLDAVRIRIGLGQDDLAKADAGFLDDSFGGDRAHRHLAAQAHFAIGEAYVVARDWERVIDHYGEYLARYGRRGGRDFEIRATILAAEGHWNLAACPASAAGPALQRCREHRAAAHDHAARANGMVELPDCGDRQGAADPAAAATLLAQCREESRRALAEQLALEVDAEADESHRAEILGRLEQAARALGQARFYLGERLYDRFVGIRWPEFDPDDRRPDRGAVDRCQETIGLSRTMCTLMEKYDLWKEDALVAFVRSRHAALQEARSYYDSIAFLAVPAWEIAAASRVGDMYLQFWRDLYRAPLPPALEDPTFADVAEAYRAALDEAAEPYRRQAAEAYRYCLITARREQWFNEYSSRCEESLSEIDPERYRVSDETYARPRLDCVHYALPDIDLGLITTRDETGGPSLPVDVVPGAPSVDERGRFHFLPAVPPGRV